MYYRHRGTVKVTSSSSSFNWITFSLFFAQLLRFWPL